MQKETKDINRSKAYKRFKQRVEILKQLDEYIIIKNDDDGYSTGDIINLVA